MKATTGSEAERKRSSRGRNLTHSLLDEVGRTIVTGEYEHRPFPTEAELAKQYGVSRSVTREALKMLTAKGLLAAKPRRGTVVQPTSSWSLFDPDVLRWLLERSFSLDLLRQFSQLRIAVEPAAAELAARGAPPQNVARIAAGYERMVRAEEGADDPLESDIAFHVAVLEASGNPFYVQFRDMVATALRTSIRFTNRIKGRSASLPAHHAVLAAIQARRPERARAAMTAIISEVMGLIDAAEAKGVKGEGWSGPEAAPKAPSKAGTYMRKRTPSE